MPEILILGAGFAGLWSAIAAARHLDALGIPNTETRVTVIDRTPAHSIRVRNYEPDLAGTTIPLAEILDPIGVRHIQADVSAIDPAGRTVTTAAGSVPYDRLVFALGSRLAPPPIPGLAQHGFDVDTTAAATRLARHLAALPRLPPGPARATALVVGAGLTGIEVATELPARLRAALPGQAPRVILADRNATIAAAMGEARPVIDDALRALGIETRPGTTLAAIDPAGATLASGERIEAATIVWCGGLQANPLAACIPAPRDPAGRLPVDPHMKVLGRPEFAAGDAAWFAIDGTNPSVMSCQHARPMGRFAGHNVVADLLGLPMLPLRIDWYATILDLGPWGAVQTTGRDRRLLSAGSEAKRIKQTINRHRIYPPRSGIPQEILEAATPNIQPPPASTPP